jgi:transketolase
MRGAVRLAALMQLPVTYVWTHDSIGLGEDGPTHQPIEHLAALRAIPGLDIVRPADANETAAAWKTVMEHNDRPAGMVLTRQNVPVFPRGEDGFSDTSNVHRGGYVLLDVEGGLPDRETVIPPTVKARVSVEAGIAQGWREIVGDHGRIISIEHYGASAEYSRIYREFGITAEAVAAAAEDSIRVASK